MRCTEITSSVRQRNCGPQDELGFLSRIVLLSVPTSSNFLPRLLGASDKTPITRV